MSAHYDKLLLTKDDLKKSIIIRILCSLVDEITQKSTKILQKTIHLFHLLRLESCPCKHIMKML